MRDSLRSSQLSPICAYELIVVFGLLEKAGSTTNPLPKDYIAKDYEPVGLPLYREWAKFRKKTPTAGRGQKA